MVLSASVIYEIFNTILSPLLDLVTLLIGPILDQLQAMGFREPVVQFMLINAILGVSIYMTLNCGLFSLANAGFMAIGAYVGVIVTQHSSAPLGVSVILGALAAGLFAIPIGLPVLRLRNIYLAIATIGFGEIVRIVILNFDQFATDLLNPDKDIQLTYGALGIKRIPKITETSHLVFFLILLGFFLVRMDRSRFGRAMKAIRQDEKVASTLGIHVVYYKNVAFILGAMIAGVAGVFSAHATRIITPGDYGFSKAVDILSYAVLGGLGHWSGPMIGGMALKAIPERLRYLNQYTGALTGAVLLFIIVYLPQGIVSLAQPSFWKQDGRFGAARRLALVGLTVTGLVAILPFRDLGRSGGLVLGYEYWKLPGAVILVVIAWWIYSRKQREAGGYFNLWMTAAAALGVLALLIVGQTDTITHLSDGYYVSLFGLILIAAAGAIRYPPQPSDQLTEPAS